MRADDKGGMGEAGEGQKNDGVGVGEFCYDKENQTGPKEPVNFSQELTFGLLESKVPADFYEKLFKEEKQLTHGYVHGHIHRHKDHTHIHGHIHNHDHGNSGSHGNMGDSIAGGGGGGRGREDKTLAAGVGDGGCNSLEEVSLCKDIFCDELNDCFFANCDTKKECKNVFEDGCVGCSDKCDGCCVNDENDKTGKSSSIWSLPEGIESSMVCNDPSCVDESISCDTSVDCCGIRAPEPCFTENGVPALKRQADSGTHNSYSTTDSTDDSCFTSYKKQKLSQDNNSNFEIHFPQDCHPSRQIDHDIDSAHEMHHHHNSNDRNQFRQSCFHTLVPNFNLSLQDPQDKNKLSDYDFYIQFNNLKHCLDATDTKFKHNDEHSSAALSSIDYTTQGLKNELGSPSATGANQGIANSPMYACQWDDCLTKVSSSNFLKHVVDQHIEKEYGLNLGTEDATFPKESYHCEWNHCDYNNTDLSSLIRHLNSHRPDLMLLNEDVNILTPNSLTKSGDSSPINSGSEKHPYSSMNIDHTSVKPKTQCTLSSCCGDSKTTYTCKWKVGMESATGKPIPCNKIHHSKGDLHNHLVNDHIGLGKSVYSCQWIGCERLDGKCFTQRQKLKRHIHIHTNFKPCKCELCGASFAVETTLQQHMRTHSGEKPFTCLVCGKKFATGSSLSIHNRVHTGEKPLQCKWPGCGKRFSESSNLTKHMKTHTKNLHCEICGKEFNSKARFDKHMNSHMNSLPQSYSKVGTVSARI